MAERLKEVAARAGVSIATVSRFLSGKAVRPAVRQALEAALAEKGYEPDLAARRLVTRRSTVIGLIVPDIGNPFFLRFAGLVEDMAWRAGYRLIVCNSNEDAEREARYVSLLKEERVSGLIVAPAVNLAPNQARRADDFPAVLFDRCPTDCSFDTVMLDNANASGALLQKLLDDGVRRPVGIFTRSPVVGAERHAGFTKLLSERGIAARTMLVGHGAAAQAEAVREALDRWPDADALIAGNSPLMFAAAAVLKDRGHPASLAGFDQADWLRLIDRPTYWVEQPIEEIAHATVALLLERDPEGRPRHLVFRGKIRSNDVKAFAERGQL